MVVCVAHIVLARILEIVGAVGPGIRNQRGFAGKVIHTAHSGLCTAPGPRGVIAPIIVVRVDICSVDEIELIGLEMIERG